MGMVSPRVGRSHVTNGLQRSYHDPRHLCSANAFIFSLASICGAKRTFLLCRRKGEDKSTESPEKLPKARMFRRLGGNLTNPRPCRRTSKKIKNWQKYY